MDWVKTGNTVLGLAAVVAALVGFGALSAGLMVGVSDRLVGFRVPFKRAFQAVLATMLVTLFIRGIGLRVNELVGYGVGSALTLVTVIYFLAWYLNRHVPRPDGTALGPVGGYWLAGVHATLMIVVTIVAYAMIGRAG